YTCRQFAIHTYNVAMITPHLHDALPISSNCRLGYTPSTTRSNISDGPKVCTISACELNIMVWWKVCGDWLRSVSSTPLKRWITITPVYAVALKQVYVSAVVYQCGADAAVSPTVEIFVEQCDGYRTGSGGSHNVMADLHCRCTNGAYCR